jgi:hypothetical protein
MVTSKPERLDRAELRQAAAHPLNVEKLLLGLGLLLPPVAWAGHLALSYGLVYPAQDAQSKLLLHLVTVITAALTLCGAALGLRALRRAPKVAAERAVDEAEPDRSRFLAHCACALGVFFFLATLAQSVATLLLRLGARS